MSAGPPALAAACSDVRGLFGAAACSVARVSAGGDELEFVASDGAGAAAILGVRMPVTRGIAGFVALSGQPLAVGDVAQDRRFARDIAESTEFVPTAIVAVPLVDDEGEVVGVLSVLDPARDADQHARLAGRLGTAAELAVLSVVGSRLSAVLAAERRVAGLEALAGDDDLLAAVTALAAAPDRVTVRAALSALVRLAGGREP